MECDSFWKKSNLFFFSKKYSLENGFPKASHPSHFLQITLMKFTSVNSSLKKEYDIFGDSYTKLRVMLMILMISPLYYR